MENKVNKAIENRKRFIKAIVPLSKADNYKEAIEEWSYVLCVEGGGRCICSQKLSAHYVIIRNNILNTQAIIGVNCAEHIKKAEFKKARDDLDRIKHPEMYCQICMSKMRNDTKKNLLYCPCCRKEALKKKKEEEKKNKSKEKIIKQYEKIIKEGKEKRINIGNYKGAFFINVYKNNSTYHIYVEQNAKKSGYKTYINWAKSYERLKEEKNKIIENE